MFLVVFLQEVEAQVEAAEFVIAAPAPTRHLFQCCYLPGVQLPVAIIRPAIGDPHPQSLAILNMSERHESMTLPIHKPI